MATAQDILDQYFLEMRWRCLSLAADIDRVQRAPDGGRVLESDPRLQRLQRAIQVLADNELDRARRVEMIFSDLTPPPAR